MYAHGMWRGLHLYKIFKETISRTSLEFSQDSTKRNYYGQLSFSHREYYVGAGKCNISKLFESFSALEHLHLNDMSFAAGAGEVPMKLSYDLYCVKHLSISSIYLSDSDEVESDDNDIPALESLQVGRFSDVTFIHLREVKLMQTNGTIPGLQLMKLPFAKSPKMMRMLIEPCLVEESATIKILAELIKFERASPNAEVEYKLDKHSNPRRV
ncbi:hypothetical protein P3L10_031117 [Capsicum annuum]|uniref:uncharacterized protein LOC124888780 n=1 Tax=Capsicum annuum TaxID=4072 RepID=UPI001FB1013D|nr:uncharacterized protein LOC124888780 [Capsicum annuum]